MNSFKPITIALLLIALAIIAPTQNWRATAQTPFGSSADRSPGACKTFETKLEARNAGTWNSLNIQTVEEPDKTRLANAALERLGGSRTVLEVDAKALRKEMLEQGRDELRRIIRTAKIGSPAAVSIHDDTIQFFPRAGTDDATLLSAIRPLLSGPMPPLIGVNLDKRSIGDVVILAVPKQLYDERRKTSEEAGVRILTWRVQELGVETALIQPLGEGRILVVLPGVKNFERLRQILPRHAKLKFQIVDQSNDRCSISAGPNDNLEQLIHRPTGTLVFVKRTIIASGENLLAVAAIKGIHTGEPAVALRFDPHAASRMAEASSNNIGGQVAISFDNELIEAPIMREPFIDGAIQLSGGLNIQQAREMATLLGAGILPAPLTVVETRVIEPR
jgi:preprotein translocase subunit SecD